MGNRSKDAQKVIEYLYDQPVIDVMKAAEIIGKSKVSAYKLIADLEKVEILEEITGKQRDKLYIFKDYVNLF